MNRSSRATSRVVPAAVLSAIALLVAVLVAPPTAGATGSAPGRGDAHAMGHRHGHALTASQVAFHDAMRKLWEDHITIAVELLQAAKNGESAAFDDARVRWYANSDDIADHLSSLNPAAWPRSVVRAMMRTHLDQTLTEAADELGGDFAGSVAAYDAIHAHILEMADTLSSGIIAQFPRRFR